MAESFNLSSAGFSRADELWRRVGAAAGPVGELTSLQEKVRDCAWKIVPRDVQGLTADELYEAVLPVAFEAADEKRRRAYEAIDAH